MSSVHDLTVALWDAPTLANVDGAELKLDTGAFRVWMECPDCYFVEQLVNGAWRTRRP